MSLLEALSNGNMNKARDIVLEEIYKTRADRNSWNSPQYNADQEIQKSIKLDRSRDSLFTYSGLITLRSRYFLKDANSKIVEGPQDFIARVATGICLGDAAFAQRLYDHISKFHFMPATPILTNSGTTRGQLISCFLNRAEDKVESVCGSIIAENASVSKGGGGIGTYYGDVRGKGAKVGKSGGIAGGTIPFIKMIDSLVPAINQAGARKGAAAVYTRIDHPDIQEFIQIRKPTGGDDNRRCMNLNNGICVTDEFMRAVEEGLDYDLICPNTKKSVGKLNARNVWREILRLRVETGEPYILFVDTVNREIPQHHADKSLEVVQSNLCIEITLPTTYDRTAVCCLGSFNLKTYDEWKDNIADISYDAVKALDNVLELFITKAPDSYVKAKRSAELERSIGLGVMGYHDYLMHKGVWFESILARSINKNIFTAIEANTYAASVALAKERGVCKDGGERRNSSIMAIAPTATISTICGGASPCIEPINGNAFTMDTMDGTYISKNVYLEPILEKYGMNTIKVWQSITNHGGSVQHLDFLSDDEKKVFKTNSEINQKELIIQASHRQKIMNTHRAGQSQSLNLFFQGTVDFQSFYDIHLLAWKLGVKSLYYVRTDPNVKADTADKLTEKVAIKAKAPTQECLVCQ